VINDHAKESAGRQLRVYRAKLFIIDPLLNVITENLVIIRNIALKEALREAMILESAVEQESSQGLIFFATAEDGVGELDEGFANRLTGLEYLR